jgi:outer membrane lipoprotein-sorting protein
MVAELKNNPLITVLLAFLLAALGAIGVLQQASFSQLWSKLDRVTTLMMEKESQIRNENQAIRSALVCTDQEVVKIKETLRHHLETYEKEEAKRIGGGYRR